jgi:hypothetical protein
LKPLSRRIWVFEGVQTLRYLDTLINLKKHKSREIKSSIAVGHKFFYSLDKYLGPDL